MPSYGDEVACPGCGAAHVVRVGEINPRRQIEFVCSSCGGTVTMEHNGSLAVVRPQKPGSFSRGFTGDRATELMAGIRPPLPPLCFPPLLPISG